MPNAEFEVTVKVNITPRILQLPLLPVSAPITAVPFNSVHLIHLSLSLSTKELDVCIRWTIHLLHPL